VNGEGIEKGEDCYRYTAVSETEEGGPFQGAFRRPVQGQTKQEKEEKCSSGRGRETVGVDIVRLGQDASCATKTRRRMSLVEEGSDAHLQQGTKRTVQSANPIHTIDGEFQVVVLGSEHSAPKRVKLGMEI
jgi:hypothetical protein